VQFIPGWVSEIIQSYGRFDIGSIPAIEKGGRILALIGDDAGLTEMQTIIVKLPELESWQEQVAQHIKDSVTFKKILDAVTVSPGCLQKDLKTLIEEPNGARLPSLASYLEKVGRIVRIKSGKTYKLVLPGSPESAERQSKKMNLQFAIPRELYSTHLQEGFADIVTENVKLIEEAPPEYHADFAEAVRRSITDGTGLWLLENDIQQLMGIPPESAGLIALDITRKVQETLSRVRYEGYGLEEYTWRYPSGSVEPCHFHLEYEDKIFRYDTPILVQKATKTQSAMYGWPGTAKNCRC
jgi:hypothetical protein